MMVNALMLLAANIWPGWEVVPFLSRETPLVMSWVNVAIVVNLVANAAYFLRDPVWLRSVGDLVTLGVGTAVMVRIWQVFPFDLTGSGMDWALVLRIVLVLGIFGSVIGMIAAAGTLVRNAPRS
jgi:hypothetical protein